MSFRQIGIGKLILYATATAAAAIHIGTALLRLNTFWPYPKLLDFASFYAGAEQLAQNVNPYAWDPTRVEYLRAYTGLAVPEPNSAPAALYLLTPFTFAPFPLSAMLWLVLLVAIALVSSVMLAQTAGYTTWKPVLIVTCIVLTFGPTVLNFTIGQNGPFLLLATLIAGLHLVQPRRWTGAAVVVSWTVANAMKVFPLFWLPAFALLRRLKLMLAVAAATVILSLASHTLAPEASADYWLRFLPDKFNGYSSTVALDDQYLGAWFNRIGRSHEFTVPGVSAAERSTVRWRSPWEFEKGTLDIAAYVVLSLLGATTTWTIWRKGSIAPDAALYAWVLYCALLIPHTERYNHVLLLPMMAWLWKNGVGGRTWVIAVYFLTALSRLTHLWAVLLPAPYAPLLTGSGVIAVVALLAGYMYTLSRETESGAAGLPISPKAT